MKGMRMEKPEKVCSLKSADAKGFVAVCGRTETRRNAETPAQAAMTGWASMVTCPECNEVSP